MQNHANNHITQRQNLVVKAFFDEESNTVTYLVWDKVSLDGAVIDPVFDFNSSTGTANTLSADRVLNFARGKNVKLKFALETHAHADHLSGAPYIKVKTGAKIGIGEGIHKVQEIFRPLFNQNDDDENSDFDLLLSSNEPLYLGEMKIDILLTPGHTPACVSYKIEDSIFVGDTLFMPDIGTARCDFPGGSAATLYESIQFILSHPQATKLYMCHDYKPVTRDEFKWETDVKEQSETNIHINNNISKAAFIELRNSRDSTLNAPKLLLPAIQVNINAGNLPKAEDNGVSYIKIPIKL